MIIVLKLAALIMFTGILFTHVKPFLLKWFLDWGKRNGLSTYYELRYNHKLRNEDFEDTVMFFLTIIYAIIVVITNDFISK